MKKRIVFLLVIMSLFLASCKVSSDFDDHQNNKFDDSVTVKWADITENRPDIARKFDYIGDEHNKILSDVYAELVNFKDSKRSVHGDNRLSDEEISFVINRYFNKFKERSTSENEVESIDAVVFKFSKQAETFVEKIKTLLQSVSENSSQVEIEQVIGAIEQIEKNAETVILPSEKECFYAYTATSRASLAYWYNNLEKWDIIRGESYKDARYISVWRRLAGCVASDAGGAITGWDQGAKIAEMLVPDNKKLKLVIKISSSAIVAGFSSAEGWRQGKYVIVVPHEWLIKKAKEKIADK